MILGLWTRVQRTTWLLIWTYLSILGPQRSIWLSTYPVELRLLLLSLEMYVWIMDWGWLMWCMSLHLHTICCPYTNCLKIKTFMLSSHQISAQLWTSTHMCKMWMTSFKWSLSLVRSTNYNSTSKLTMQCLSLNSNSLSNRFTLWHNRLGDAFASKLEYIDYIKHFANMFKQICLTCPMAKFSKLPFSTSESCAS